MKPMAFHGSCAFGWTNGGGGSGGSFGQLGAILEVGADACNPFCMLLMKFSLMVVSIS